MVVNASAGLSIAGRATALPSLSKTTPQRQIDAGHPQILAIFSPSESFTFLCYSPYPGCSKTVLSLYPVLPVQPFSLCPVFGLAAEVPSSPVLLTLRLTPRREEKMQLSLVVTPGACWGQSRIVCKGQAKGAHLTAQAPTCSGTGILREYLFYRKCLNMH